MLALETVTLLPGMMYGVPSVSRVNEPDNPNENEPVVALIGPVNVVPETVAMILSRNPIVIVLPAPPSVNDIPVLEVRTRSFASDDVALRTMYDAVASKTELFVDDIVICPFDADATVILEPAAIYDVPSTSLVNEPDIP